MTKELVIYRLANPLSIVQIPFYESRLQAGFPSPAIDYTEESIDLNKLVIKDEEATFFARVNGTSMIDAHLVPGCWLAVDRSIIPVTGDIVVAVLLGEFTVKYYKVENGQIWLIPANKDYKPMEINECHDFRIWGVVVGIVIRPRIHSK